MLPDVFPARERNTAVHQTTAGRPAGRVDVGGAAGHETTRRGYGTGKTE